MAGPPSLPESAWPVSSTRYGYEGNQRQYRFGVLQVKRSAHFMRFDHRKRSHYDVFCSYLVDPGRYRVCKRHYLSLSIPTPFPAMSPQNPYTRYLAFSTTADPAR